MAVGKVNVGGGYGKGEIVPGTITQDILQDVWSTTVATGYINSIVLDNRGNLYTGDNNTKIRKISPLGVQVWVFDGFVTAVSQVVMDKEGNVYGCGQGLIVKLNSDGVELWRYTDAKPYTDMCVDNDGFVYAGGYQNFIRLSDTGVLMWQKAITVKGLVVDKSNDVYVTTPDQGQVNKLNKLDGTYIWSGGATITGSGGGKLAIDSTGTIYCLVSGNSVAPISPSGVFGERLAVDITGANTFAIDKGDNYYFTGQMKFMKCSFKFNVPNYTMWSKTTGSGGSQMGYSIATDTKGNIYVGRYDGVILKVFNGVKIVG